MARSTKKIQLIWLAVATILGLILVAGLVVILVNRQKKPTYFNDNSVKIIDFESSTGPVSPQYQSSRSLIITPTSCTYIVTNFGQNAAPVTTNCQISQQGFEAIAAAYKDQDVQNKLGGKQTQNNLIGGPTNTITITTADGNQLKANVTPELKNQISSWLKTVQQYVPQVGEMQY
ncbi:hypothetical protein HYX70_02070 [Candidatus Saccharibacteria bacterium]|nr:hypothetical protein [Candidatus Saccharibacteria bacterium]